MFTAKTYHHIGRLALALVLIVASSGFTVVLHSCLMEDRACCDAPMAADGTTGARIGNGASSCCEDTIAGGLHRTAATLETQQAAHHLKTVLAVVTPDLPVGQLQDPSWLLNPQQLRPPDPPATGLYLANAALLI